MKYFFLFILFSVTSAQIFSQTFSIKGNIEDKETGTPLSYSNVRVLNSSLGTASNFEGEYEIKLSAGNYKLIASFIGYKTDTISIDLKSNVENMNFRLIQTDVSLPEIVIVPGENPALEIIRRAIQRKNERNKKI